MGRDGSVAAATRYGLEVRESDPDRGVTLSNVCEILSLTLREGRRLSVFENRVLRGIFGPERNEVTREWRKLNNKELNDLYCSPTFEHVIRSRRTRSVGHVARMGRGEACTGFWWGNLKERGHWGDPGTDGRIILRRIFRKGDMNVWRWLRIETGCGHL
jgi:hypothetical protein